MKTSGGRGPAEPPSFRHRAGSVFLLAMVCWLMQASRAVAWEALSTYWGGLGGYTPSGAGFVFSTTTNIEVSALGVQTWWLGNDPQEISLWENDGQRLASVVITVNSPSFNQTSYEPVPPVRLGPGQTYFLSCAPIVNGIRSYWIGRAIVPPYGGFSLGPELVDIRAASEKSKTTVFPLTIVAQASAFEGPNFSYSIPGSPPVIRIESLEFKQDTVHVAFTLLNAPAASFTLLQATQITGPWTTNLNGTLTTNVPGISYTFSAPAGGDRGFFRIRTP